METPTKPTTLRPGTPVRTPDGREGWASPDRAVGRPWDGTTYRVRDASTDALTFWQRDQLEVL